MNRIINYLVDAIGGVLFYFGQTKLRTALTLMGITVGVSSIIAIMTVLETFEQSTESLVADMKTNIFYITKDNPVQVQFGNDAGWGKRKIPRITWDEYEQLKSKLGLDSNFMIRFDNPFSSLDSASYNKAAVVNAQVLVLYKILLDLHPTFTVANANYYLASDILDRSGTETLLEIQLL